MGDNLSQLAARSPPHRALDVGPQGAMQRFPKAIIAVAGLLLAIASTPGTCS